MRQLCPETTLSPTMLRPHPLNSQQTLVLLGTIPGFAAPRLGACPVPWFGPQRPGECWCVALSHLAHARGECGRCEPVWRSADEQWDARNDEAFFAAIELSHREGDGSTITRLVRLDDVPAGWADA